MQKRFYKNVFSGNDCWVATSNAFPLHPFAAEQNVKVLQENVKTILLDQQDSKM